MRERAQAALAKVYRGAKADRKLFEKSTIGPVEPTSNDQQDCWFVALGKASYKYDYRVLRIWRNLVLLLALPLMLFFIMFARQSIFLLAGPAYFGAVRPMQCIMPARERMAEKETISQSQKNLEL